MLRERVIVAIVLVPLFVWVINIGGWVFVFAIAIILALAAWEYGHIYRPDFAPSRSLLVVGVVAISIGRFWAGLEGSALFLTAITLLAMAWHLVDYERGAERSGSDFAITASGVLYLGWIGSYLISLRQLPDGGWWFLIALPAVWLADSAAYFVGKWIGRNQLSPRLSPKKTWEGYSAGIVAAGLAGLGFTYVWRIAAGSATTLDPQYGLLTGIAVGILAPLGDLGVSMVKREIGVKDTGSLLPGHGGVLDRIDSWIWAGVIGYYVIYWLTA